MLASPRVSYVHTISQNLLYNEGDSEDDELPHPPSVSETPSSSLLRCAFRIFLPESQIHPRNFFVTEVTFDFTCLESVTGTSLPLPFTKLLRWLCRSVSGLLVGLNAPLILADSWSLPYVIPYKQVLRHHHCEHTEGTGVY